MVFQKSSVHSGVDGGGGNVFDPLLSFVEEPLLFFPRTQHESCTRQDCDKTALLPSLKIEEDQAGTPHPILQALQNAHIQKDPLP